MEIIHPHFDTYLPGIITERVFFYRCYIHRYMTPDYSVVVLAPKINLIKEINEQMGIVLNISKQILLNLKHVNK